MGGPQVNGMQLLAAGQADAVMGYDIAVMKGREQGINAVTVAASFQKDLQGMMTHDDVKSLAGLKDKTVLIEDLIIKPDRVPLISTGPSDKRSRWEGKPPEQMFDDESSTETEE